MGVHQNQTPHPDVIALYLSPWLRSCGPMYVETVREAIADARESHARRNMDIEQALRLDYERNKASYPPEEHAALLEWAHSVINARDAGTLSNDPHHDGAPSGYSYRGIPATWGDLRAAYADDLPDGW